MNGIIVWLIVGAIAGWLAGYIMSKDTGFQIMDLVLGVVGALVGGYLGSMLLNYEPAAISVGGIAMATIGALLVAFIYKKITGKSIA